MPTIVWAGSVLLYLLLALALWQTRGLFRPSWVLDVSLAFAAWSVLHVWAKPHGVNRIRRAGLVAAVAAAFFVLLVLRDSRLLYASPAGLLQLRVWFWLIALVLAAAGAAMLRHLTGAAERLLAASALAIAAVRIVVLTISPAPHIDVFVSNTHAADLFLSGHNPYLGSYVDIYGGQFDYAPGFVYWPVVLFLQSAAQLLAGDIRAVSIAADCVTAVFSWLLLRRRGCSRLQASGWLLAWFTFPVHLFVLEQSWVDPVLVAIVAVTMYCLDSGRWLWSAVAVGVGLATKQYFVVFAALWALWLLRRAGFGAALRLALTSAGVCLAVLVPFLAHDAEAFLRMSVFVPLQQAFRPDSFSFVAYLHRSGVAAAGAWYAVPPLAAMTVWALRLWRGAARDVTPTTLAQGAFFVYMSLFLFGKQAFCNYYLFAAFFLWFVIAVPAAGRPDEAAR